MHPATSWKTVRRDRDWLESPLNWQCFWAFVIGLGSRIPIKFIGIVYLSEILLIGLFLWVVFAVITKPKFWTKISLRFAILLGVSLAGYVITDLLRGTATDDLLKGWSRLIFIFVDFLALYHLSRRATLGLPSFFLGYGLGALVYFLIAESFTQGFEAYWKFEFSPAITLIVLGVLALRFRSAPRYGAYVLCLLGVLDIFLDNRAAGLIRLTVAAILFAAMRTRKGRRVNKYLLFGTATVCLIGLAAIYIRTQGEYSKRRSTSNSFRIGSTVATIKGIQRSPVIGNGSQSTDAEMDAWQKEAELLGGGRLLGMGKEGFVPHSEILQAWYEGGILGELFFLYYGLQLAATILTLLRRPLDYLSPLFLYVILEAAWALLFSPLAGSLRLYIGAAMAIICYVDSERTNRQRQGRAPQARKAHVFRSSLNTADASAHGQRI